MTDPYCGSVKSRLLPVIRTAVASSCGCQIDLVVMVPETKRDVRRFDEDSDSLKLPDRVSQGC